MEARPIIKPTVTSSDNIVEWICGLVLFLMWILTIYVFIISPDIIPIHFNGSGKVDNYGSKIFIFLLPSIATGIYFSLTALSKYPHIFNYLSKITFDNALQQYTNATRMLRYLKLVILIIFTTIIFVTYLNIIAVKDGLGNWFLPLIIILLLIPTIIFLAQTVKKKNIQ